MTASIFLSNGTQIGNPSSNSVTQFLTTVLRVEANAFEILSKLSEIVAGTSQTIQVTVENTDGTNSSYELPSIGYLKNEIQRIDKNFKLLSGMEGEAIVRMADGSYKKIIEPRLFKEPAAIGALSVPAKFYNRPNWFFESFMSPLLFVNFDLSKYVEFDMQHAFVKRVIINASSDSVKTYFDNNYKGRNDVDHDTLLQDLVKNSIGYFVDEDTVALPSTLVRYSGKFNVVSITEEVQQTLNDDEETVSTKVKRYILDTLVYSDNLLNVKNSMTLKVGDVLDLDEITQFEVTFIDASNYKIGVKKLSGVDPIGIGSVLSISPVPFAIKNLQVNVGYDEREVIFVKPIDNNFNVTTRDFSPGVAIFTNDLTIDTAEGAVTFEEYYKTQVSDFGNTFLSAAKEKPVPAIYAISPDAPTPSVDNFKVVLINSQKLDTSSIEEIKKKTAQKNSVFSEIAQLDIAIEKKKQDLNTSKFNSDAERNAVKNQLDELIREKTAKSNLYSSLVKDLSTLAQNPPATIDSPKYRVRGFWQIPQPKVAEKTSPQNVIQFLISYRYLSLDGTAPGVEQYDFKDSSGSTVRAYFSNWIEYKTEIRKKIFDTSTGTYVWEDENVQDADSVNINQLDIPISKGEKVEIRIKSISEAGWPVNPAMSDWSNSIVVDFPSELEQEEEITTALKQADAEQIRVEFNQDLASKGLDIHLSSSFILQDKYYAHGAEAIASGFFRSDGSIIDLYTKLTELENNYNQLKALIEKAKGVLTVTVVDPFGVSYPVSNNSTISLFSGYYQDRANTLPSSEEKGAIFNDIYKIVLQNSAASVLQLVSQYPGGLDVDLAQSDPSTNKDYDVSRRYDIVPLNLTSLRTDSTENGKKFQAGPFQSSQALSQYMYCRATDIGLKNYLVDWNSAGSTSVSANSYYPNMVGTTPATFVWNGNYSGTAPSGNGYLTDFAIHVDHPDLNLGTASTLTSLNEPTIVPGGPASYPKFVHAYAFERESSATDSMKQARYIVPNMTGATADKYPVKLGFYVNDRYLIGSKTCGAYLYLAPTSYADLLVEGTDFRAIRSVEFGETNKIEIPVIFQFRMTDYYGAGNAGTGRVGGIDDAINLTYVKKIGIDISVKEESTFSFDIMVTAKYKVDTPSQASIKPAGKTVAYSSQQKTILDRNRII